ncbi:MAG: threonylcarbamoyl-AMP synthase [Syntrophaceae bacterium]|nr:threonylcarbamoyl-AMP synthase [Syntrophaceae bacterium]
MACPILKSDPKGIQEAARIILQGGVIAFPTETFYGLAADAWNEAAVKKIFQIKGREEGKPILLLVADRSWLSGLVLEVNPLAERLMENFWPGPLTLVFRASPDVSPLLTAGTEKIGIRHSPHPVTQALVQAVGKPVTGTSANLSGQPSMSTAREVFHSLGKGLDAILDGGKTPGGLGSTVLDISEDSPRMVREGVLSSSELAGFWG